VTGSHIGDAFVSSNPARGERQAARRSKNKNPEDQNFPHGIQFVSPPTLSLRDPHSAPKQCGLRYVATNVAGAKPAQHELRPNHRSRTGSSVGELCRGILLAGRELWRKADASDVQEVAEGVVDGSLSQPHRP